MNRVVEDLKNRIETVWINYDLEHVQMMSPMCNISYLEMKAAQNRLLRFMPYLETVFADTKEKKGLIESDIIGIDGFTDWMKSQGINLSGRVLLKDDAHLPIAGSVKARGGIYEVLLHAEQLALGAGMLKVTDNYSIFASDEFKKFFGQYTIQVGSTGNLGLSIGIMSAKLGFKVIVHMSIDAKEWKKELLRSVGVDVREYEGDYSEAVANGRRMSDSDEKSYFVDDENSKDLFMGYAVSALRLKVQLYKGQITVDNTHPLFVYIPCGVGGAPGGIAYGLKQMYGDDVHIFTAEPVNAPCMILSCASKLGSDISISDVGIDGKTIADGLAVGRSSKLASGVLGRILSGAYTVNDDDLINYMKVLYEQDGIFIEPSACAGLHGICQVSQDERYLEYIKEKGLTEYMNQATHIVWATGGGLVPDDVRKDYLEGSLGILP